MLRAVRLLCHHMVHAEGRAGIHRAAGPRRGTDPTNIIWLSTRLLTAIKARVVRATNPADIQQQKSHPLTTNDPTTPSNLTLKPACPRPHSRSPFSPSGGGQGIGRYVSKYTVHVIEPRRHKSEETPLITAAHRQPARCEGLLNNPWPRERAGDESAAAATAATAPGHPSLPP